MSGVKDENHLRISPTPGGRFTHDFLFALLMKKFPRGIGTGFDE